MNRIGIAVKRRVLFLAAILTGIGTVNANDRVCSSAAVNQEWAKALTACTLAAEGGNATAQFNLGLMYSLGRGVAQDYAKSAHWYAQAAKQGDSDSQNNLGLMHYKGQGVVQDYAQALRWYKLAAEQGNVLAQNNLGSMYRSAACV